jgi:protein-disulfide isomerase
MAPASTTKTSTLRLSLAGQDANPLVLPIVFEPNGSYLGDPAARVTVLQFGDYQCPYCAGFFRSTWPQLKAEYVDTGKVRFQFQDFAFLGSDSTTSAMAAHCAGDQYRYWQYHDYLYAHQGNENSGWGTPAHQKEFAAAMGLDAGQFGQCLDSNKYLSQVQGENADSRSRGINSVPSFLVNGTKVAGSPTLAALEQAINAALNQP